MKAIPEEHMKEKCRPGLPSACRYMILHQVFCCVKNEPDLKKHIDRKVRQGCLKTKGDNCQGL